MCSHASDNREGGGNGGGDGGGEGGGDGGGDGGGGDGGGNGGGDGGGGDGGGNGGGDGGGEGGGDGGGGDGGGEGGGDGGGEGGGDGYGDGGVKGGGALNASDVISAGLSISTTVTPRSKDSACLSLPLSESITVVWAVSLGTIMFIMTLTEPARKVSVTYSVDGALTILATRSLSVFTF